ncbi:MAG: VOC family protein [Alphaproteobacteria bacterium]
MPDIQRGIDHLVLCARDLEAARAAYGSFGFTTTPPARHPFGTANSLVQLQGSFLELIAVADPAEIRQPLPGAFSFGQYIRKFLQRREGMSMLVFESRDAGADQAEFLRKGIDTYDPFHFERQAQLPDGQSVIVGFSLAFATTPDMPEAVFFTCQQHAPQYFWKPEYQSHANGARAISEIVMVAESPGHLARFFARLQPPCAVSLDSKGLQVVTSRGQITVITTDAFMDRYGAPAHGPDTPYFAAYTILVADLDATAAVLRGNDVKWRRRGESIVIDAGTAFGALLEFTGER